MSSSSPCCKVCDNPVLKTSSSSSTSPIFKRRSADWRQLCFLIGSQLPAPFCSTCTGQLSRLLGLIKNYNKIEQQLKRGVAKFQKMPGVATKMGSNHAVNNIPKFVSKRRPIRKTIAALKIEPVEITEHDEDDMDAENSNQDDTVSGSIPAPKRSLKSSPSTTTHLTIDRSFYLGYEFAPINNTLTCLTCGWCTTSVATQGFDICTHIKTEHKYDHRCPHCDKKFVSSTGRTKHLEKVCKSLVPCETCGKPVPQEKLGVHTWSHKSPEEADAALKENCETAFITCPKCGKLYHGAHKFMEHQPVCKINWHDELGPSPALVTCRICGRPVTSEAFLPRHEWSHMNVQEQLVAIRSGQMPKFQKSEVLLKNGKVSEKQIRKWMTAGN